MKRFLYKFLLLTILLFSITACQDKLETQERYYLTSGWQYSDMGEPHEFINLPNQDLSRLSSLVDNKRGYIYLKNSFSLPQNFRNKDIYIYLGRVKISAQIYVNGHPLGKVGSFPPQQFTEGETSSYFKIPIEYLDFSKKNTISITVWCDYYGALQDLPFISSSDDVIHKAEFDNLINSKIYMIFSVVLLLVFLIYIFVFLLRRSDLENLSFGEMCFSTAFYLVTFYIGEYSIIYKHIYSFLLFEKIFNAAAPILTCYFVINFSRDCLKYNESNVSKIFRLAFSFIACLLPFFGSTVSAVKFLLHISFIIMVLQFIFPTVIVIKGFIKKDARTFRFILCFVPIYIALLSQVFSTFILKNPFNPLILSIGWLCVIFLFLSLLIGNFVKMAGMFEYMNKNLEQLVADRTEALEKEKNRALKEIDLAGFVQKSFYKIDTSNLQDFEVEITSKPMSGVSGDLYIVFITENKLDGIGIFDISGHGIASGLVTMLVKNIIENEFHKGMKLPLNEVMAKINDRIIIEKGNIENYLTGMLIRFNKDDIELVNAGHPKAIVYHAESGEIKNVEEEGINQFGAIGIADFPIDFETLHFNMARGDELVLYTDGITECTSPDNKYFGSEGILAVFKGNIGHSVKDQVTALPAALRKFSASETFNDDITYIILKKL